MQLINTSLFKVQTTRLDSWQQFPEAIQQDSSYYSDYIWRGQKSADWSLLSGLDRVLKHFPPERISIAAARHLDRFKLASRGRRGISPNEPPGENEWWALAQHNALLTPLLDWTESPFVALYFAFAKDPNFTGERAVWGLSKSVSSTENDTNEKTRVGKRGIIRGELASLEFIRPMQDENSRLVSQSGLFTRVPFGISVEEWVNKQSLLPSGEPSLMKFVIPLTGRESCLRMLNRMNINHLALFPDLYGAATHCNYSLSIEDY